MPTPILFMRKSSSRIRGLRRRVAQSLARGAGQLSRDFWRHQPLVDAPAADKDTFQSLHRAAKARTFPEVDRFEAQSGAAIDPAFVEELALHTQVVSKGSSINWAHGRVLYSALTEYLRVHQSDDTSDRITIIETGTARGFSTLCMARALSDARRAGTILTIDILPHESKIYWNCIDDLDGKKTRRELLSPWSDLTSKFVVFLWGESRALLPAVATDRVHFAFIDAAHDFDTVMFEFSHVGPRQRRGDVIVFDDVTPSLFPGIVRAVDEICERHDYDRRDIISNDERGYVVATKR